MEVSRLTLTEETQSKMRRRLSNREKGALRWQRLNDFENRGLLIKASNRKAVAQIGGYTSAQCKQGASWVSNMIKNGYMLEEFVGTMPSGRKIYKYSLTGKQPNFKRGRKSVGKDKVAMPAVKIPVSANDGIGRLEIVKDGLTIKLELPYAQIKELLTQIMGGK